MGVRPHKVTIRGQPWTLRRTRRGLGSTNRFPKGLYGYCDHTNKEIRVIPEEDFKTSQEELDTIIHETLHALFPDLDEEVVTQSGSELAAILVAAGVIPGTGR